jgi:hypothetical protein
MTSVPTTLYEGAGVPLAEQYGPEGMNMLTHHAQFEEWQRAGRG